MSKIGKQPIVIPGGVNVEIKDGLLEVKSKDVALNVKLLPGIKVEIKDGKILFIPEDHAKQTISNWGTMRALTGNAIRGATEEFLKELEIHGVGFRAEAQGMNLVLNIGFSHPVNFPIPEGIKISVDKNIIKISGHDKQLVGETAAKIRKLKRPEPYQGKGIMYKGEVIRRKAGKKAVSTT